MSAMQQLAADFAEENRVLAELLEGLCADDWERPTQFKGWTPNDVVVHLHFWNRAADLSLRDPEAFQRLFGQLAQAMQAGGLRGFENGVVAQRGTELLSAWRELWESMASNWAEVDPKARIRWAGPDMSTRSALTARQMETWAHGQEIFDLAGAERTESDRIRNIVVLGINTYAWSFQVRRMAVPGPMPHLRLTAPSGDIWEFGEGEGLVTGSAVDFCRVVAQTRNFADTGITTEGEAARLWMENAQCFAGPPETPPAPGSRG